MHARSCRVYNIICILKCNVNTAACILNLLVSLEFIRKLHGSTFDHMRQSYMTMVIPPAFTLNKMIKNVMIGIALL